MSLSSNRFAGVVCAAVVIVAVQSCKTREYNANSSSVDFYKYMDSWPQLPRDQRRDYQCPTQFSNKDFEKNGSKHTFAAHNETLAADWNALTPHLANVEGASKLKMTVINVRRVNGVPHFRYLSNGTQDDLFQPWNSSKFMVFGILGSKLRKETGAAKRPRGDSDSGRIGLVSSVKEARDNGKLPLGDLVTIATHYPEDYWNEQDYKSQIAPYTSNNVSTWAKLMAGREFSTRMYRDMWLGRKKEEFGGTFAEYNSGLSNVFFDAKGNEVSVSPGDAEVMNSSAQDMKTLVAQTAQPNRLSTAAIAEFLKRLVMHREVPEQALPYVTTEDVATLLYGAPAKESKYFQGKPGGMFHAPSVYLHSALGLNVVNFEMLEKSFEVDNSKLSEKTEGKWRIFTTLGLGPRETEGNKNELAWHGYACVPIFENGKVTNASREFIISTFLGADSTRSDQQSDAILKRSIDVVVGKLMNGEL